MKNLILNHRNRLAAKLAKAKGLHGELSFKKLNNVLMLISERTGKQSSVLIREADNKLLLAGQFSDSDNSIEVEHTQLSKILDNFLESAKRVRSYEFFIPLFAGVVIGCSEIMKALNLQHH